MSADVALWDPAAYGLPSTYEEAKAIYLELSEGVKATSNAKLLKFVEQVELQLQDSELDGNLRDSFSNIPQYGRQETRAMFRVSLPHYGGVDALKQIVASAEVAGLVVFYDLMDAVFLPDGQVFPEDKAEMWYGALSHVDDTDFPHTLKGFQKLAEPLFAAMAERHGV